MMLENEALAFGETEGDFSAVDKARVIEALGKVLPPGTLMYDAEDLRPYECDGLAAYRRQKNTQSLDGLPALDPA